MKILIFPFDLLSHYLRCIEFARHLPAQHEILFLHSHKYESLLADKAFPTFTCEKFDSDNVMRCAENFDFSWLNISDIERVFSSQVHTISSYKPDIVISDTSPTLRMAAEYCHVKHINLTNGYMTRYYALTRKIPKVHRANKYSQKLPKEIFDKITDVAEQFAFKNVHKPFRILRKKYKLLKVKSYIEELEGDINLICDLPQLFPQKKLKRNFHFIGPLLFTNTSNEKDLISRLDPAKQTLFITMGSSGPWDFVRFIHNEHYTKYNIIIAGVCNNMITGDNIISKSFLNLDEVLPYTDLMICHGGNGTIYYGLKHHLYMLFFPSNFEQEWNVQRLEYLGMGKDISDFTPEEVQSIIEEKIAEGKTTLPFEFHIPETGSILNDIFHEHFDFA